MIDHNKIVEGLRAIKAEWDAGLLRHDEMRERVAQLDSETGPGYAGGSGSTVEAMNSATDAARSRFKRRVDWVMRGHGEPE
jgi:hypothetical protein